MKSRYSSVAAATAFVIGVSCGIAAAGQPMPVQAVPSEVQTRLADTQDLCQRLERPMQSALATVSKSVARRAQLRMEKAERLIEHAGQTLDHRPNLSEQAIDRAQRELQAIVIGLGITPEPKKEGGR